MLFYESVFVIDEEKAMGTPEYRDWWRNKGQYDHSRRIDAANRLRYRARNLEGNPKYKHHEDPADDKYRNKGRQERETRADELMSNAEKLDRKTFRPGRDLKKGNKNFM